MSDTEVTVVFSETGAGFVFDEIKKVTKSIHQLQDILSTPIENDLLDPSRFSTKQMEEFTGAIHNLGIEYEKTKAKMRSPLSGSSDNMDFAKQFTASGTKGKLMADIAAIGEEASGAGNRMQMFASAMNSTQMRQGTANIRSINQEVKRTNEAAKSANYTLGFFGRIVAAMAIRSAIKNMVNFADSFTNLQNKIKTVTPAGSVAFISDQLQGIADRSRTSLESVITAYTRTTRAVQSLGKSQNEVLKFTETLSKAIQVGGSTSVEAHNAMIQLSQGMGSGALKGDELRSVLEQLPVVAQLIADKMNVPIASLRKLGSEGKLTTQVIFDAINASTDKINTAMSKMDLTVGQAFTLLNNKMIVASGRMGEAMKILANSIKWVANNLDTVITVAESAALALGTLLAARAIPAVINAFKMLTAAMMTNPWTAAAIAIATVTAALIPFVSQMKLAGDHTATFGDVWVAAWQQVTSFQGFNKASEGISTVDAAIVGMSKSTKEWMMLYAKAVDIMSVPFTPFKALTAWVHGTEISNTAETNMRRTIERAEKNIEQASIKKTVAENARLKAEQDAALARLPTFQPNQDKKVKNPKGQTFAELMEDLNKARDKAFLADDKSDMSIGAQVAREWLDAVDKLEDKIANHLTPTQAKLIEQVIEEKVVLQEMLKLREHIQESMKKEQEAQVEQLIEHIKKLIELEKSQKELVKEFQEARADRETARFEKFQGIADSLDPGQSTNREIKDLQEFMKQYKDFPEWTALASDRLDELYNKLKYGGTDPFKTFNDALKSIFGPEGTLVKGLGDATAKWLVMNQSMREFGQNLKNLLNSVTQQAVSSLLQLPLNMLMGSVYQGMMPGALPTGGSNGVTYLPGTSSTITPHKFASGGYTGNYGLNEPAGVVHGQEYVLNASATKRMGLSTLEAINKGGPMPKAGGTNVTVHNYAGVQVETNSTSPDQVEIMITKAIQQQTGRVVASHLNDANSPVSKTLQRKFQLERRNL